MRKAFMKNKKYVYQSTTSQPGGATSEVFRPVNYVVAYHAPGM